MLLNRAIRKMIGPGSVWDMDTRMKKEILSALNAMRHIYKGLALGGWVSADKRDLMTGVENLTSLIVRIEQTSTDKESG